MNRNLDRGPGLSFPVTYEIAFNESYSPTTDQARPGPGGGAAATWFRLGEPQSSRSRPES
jgi:hypothetical protein